MVPPTAPLNLDVEAISGICGAISIACWVVVFSPQIIENFRRGSADGLSLQFIIVWLAGDIFNILGAVLQGVLPTMIILAVYYTIADIVLLGQCFYYRGFTWRDDVAPPRRRRAKRVTSEATAPEETLCHGVTEQTSLLASEQSPYQQQPHQHQHQHHHSHSYNLGEHRRPSWSALSPAVPFAPVMDGPSSASESPFLPVASTAPVPAKTSSTSAATSVASHLQAVAFNAVAVLMVCAAGVAGWYLSGGSREKTPDSGADNGNDDDPLTFSVWGQIFGYFCAVLYLGSRLPQLLLNWRRQSTEGVSMLFFLFACLGNLTYVLSIFAHEDHGDYTPGEARRRYGRYLLVNLSWLAGSLGTLLLDMGIFIQFFLYRQIEDEDDSDYDSEEYGDEDDEDDEDDDGTEVATADGRGPERRGLERRETYQSFDQPILQRNMSHYG